VYLQQKNALFETYKAVREFSASDDFDSTAAGVIRLVEQSSGLLIDALNADFRDWLSLELGLRDLPQDERLNIPSRPRR
jgi:hypothetical protein